MGNKVSDTTLSGWLLYNTENSVNAPTIANDFSGIGAPKLKFLFTAEFGIRTGNELTNANAGSKSMELIQYDLKSATRPNITINNEDANYYGYRTKVATRTNFGTVRLTFYEDSFNNASGFIWKYLNSVSPLTNVKSSGIDTIGNTPIGIADGATGVGALPTSSVDGPLQYIKVYHYYSGGGYEKGGVTEYTYFNPKVESIEFDELDMSSSDASTVSITFAADAITLSNSSYEGTSSA